MLLIVVAMASGICGLAVVVGCCWPPHADDLITRSVAAQLPALDEHALRAASRAVVVYISVTSVASIVVGFGVGKRRTWATSAAIVLFGIMATTSLAAFFATPAHWAGLVKAAFFAVVTHLAWRMRHEQRRVAATNHLRDAIAGGRLAETELARRTSPGQPHPGSFPDEPTLAEAHVSDDTSVRRTSPVSNDFDYDLGDASSASDYDSHQDRLVSLVLLQQGRRYLEDMILAKIVESAWGGVYTIRGEGEMEYCNDPITGAERGYISGEPPLLVISDDSKKYLVYSLDQPYFDNLDALEREITDRELVRAVAEHQAWLSIDFVLPPDSDESAEQEYRRIAVLIAELADEETLALYHPETGRILRWTERVARKLSSAALVTLIRSEYAPRIRITGDEPEMRDAVAEAKRRWPEFVQQFAAWLHATSNKNNDAPADIEFSIKTNMRVDQLCEGVWVNVTGLEANCVRGRLATDPMNLVHLRQDDPVEIPADDVCDWFYAVGSRTAGAFTIDAVAKINKRRRAEQTSPDRLQ